MRINIYQNVWNYFLRNYFQLQTFQFFTSSILILEPLQFCILSFTLNSNSVPACSVLLNYRWTKRIFQYHSLTKCYIQNGSRFFSYSLSSFFTIFLQCHADETLQRETTLLTARHVRCTQCSPFNRNVGTICLATVTALVQVEWK